MEMTDKNDEPNYMKNKNDEPNYMTSYVVLDTKGELIFRDIHSSLLNIANHLSKKLGIKYRIYFHDFWENEEDAINDRFFLQRPFIIIREKRDKFVKILSKFHDIDIDLNLSNFLNPKDLIVSENKKEEKSKEVKVIAIHDGVEGCVYFEEKVISIIDNYVIKVKNESYSWVQSFTKYLKSKNEKYEIVEYGWGITPSPNLPFIAILGYQDERLCIELMKDFSAKMIEIRKHILDNGKIEFYPHFVENDEIKSNIEQSPDEFDSYERENKLLVDNSFYNKTISSPMDAALCLSAITHSKYINIKSPYGIIFDEKIDLKSKKDSTQFSAKIQRSADLISGFILPFHKDLIESVVFSVANNDFISDEGKFIEICKWEEPNKNGIFQIFEDEDRRDKSVIRGDVEVFFPRCAFSFHEFHIKINLKESLILSNPKLSTHSILLTNNTRNKFVERKFPIYTDIKFFGTNFYLKSDFRDFRLPGSYFIENVNADTSENESFENFHIKIYS